VQGNNNKTKDQDNMKNEIQKLVQAATANLTERVPLPAPPTILRTGHCKWSVIIHTDAEFGGEVFETRATWNTPQKAVIVCEAIATLRMIDLDKWVILSSDIWAEGNWESCVETTPMERHEHEFLIKAAAEGNPFIDERDRAEGKRLLDFFGMPEDLDFRPVEEDRAKDGPDNAEAEFNHGEASAECLDDFCAEFDRNFPEHIPDNEGVRCGCEDFPCCGH
jgi:hypothetical protein